MHGKISQNRGDHHDIGIKRIDRFNVAIDGQPTDQAIRPERPASSDEAAKIRRATLRRQFVYLRRSHNFTLPFPKGPRRPATHPNSKFEPTKFVPQNRRNSKERTSRHLFFICIHPYSSVAKFLRSSMRTLPLSREKFKPKSVPTAPIQSFWDTLLLCQAEDRAPLESDPSAGLEAGMRWGVHKSPYLSGISKTNSSWQ